MTRSLRLAKETLTDLSADQMAAVGGAGLIPSVDACPAAGPTLPLKWCIAYTLDQTW